MKKCVLIMNPESGKVKDKKNLKNVYDILRKYDYDGVIRYTKRKYDAIDIVKELDSSTDLVISCGGDGTLNEVVTGNLQREKKLTLANLPLGTTNDVGNMYGLTGTMLSNLETILKGKPKKIDVIKINDTPFVYVACLGDYIDMAFNTPRELKKKYGKIAYILYGIKQLRNKIHQYDIKYTVNGEEREGVYSFIFITNSSRIAGMDDVYYDVKLNDNKFEVALAHVGSRKEMLKMLVMSQTRDIKDIPGVTYYQTDNLKLEFLNPPKTSWCLDGEEYKSVKTVFEFKIDRSTTMLMPKENINKLFESE
ncbi:MAG: diacylglycerol kinase family lipid kinase [Bacilli bacterium]|nr:diacylglycerol kinase family lipid kinase [Bacilli bacterium]